MKKLATQDDVNFINSCNNRCLIFHAIGIVNMYFGLSALYRLATAGGTEEIFIAALSLFATWVIAKPLTELQEIRNKYIQKLPDAE